MPPKSSAATVIAQDEVPSLVHPSGEPPFKLGTSFGDYHFLSILGQGAFGTVYLAEEKSLGRKVALKVCSADVLEGRTIAQLNHEGIVRVHSQTMLEGYSVINMQFIPSVTLEFVLGELSQWKEKLSGKSFLNLLQKKQPAEASFTIAEFRNREKLLLSSYPQAIAWLGIQMAEALSHAHARGILHLDIKPANILMHPSGKPYLMDFNVAIPSESVKQGVPTNFGGTFEFMSPEQMYVFFSPDRNEAVKQVGEHSDVFSLGMVLKKLWELNHDNSPADAALGHLLSRAIHKEVEQRFRSAKELIGHLEGFLEASQIQASLPRGGKFHRWLNQHPLLGLTLVGAIPQTLAALVGFLYNATQVVSRLTPSQQGLFQEINLWYGIITGSLAMFIWGPVLLKLFRNLSRSIEQASGEARNAVLRIPLWGALVSAISWVPGAVLFPYWLNSVEGGISAATWLHLTSSFILSFLIALSYSFVVHCYLVTMTLYPRFWWGETSIRKRAFVELYPFVRKLQYFSWFTISVPLLSVLLFLYREHEFSDPKQFMMFRFLMALLISPGTAGVWFAVFATERVRAMFRLFTTSI